MVRIVFENRNKHNYFIIGDTVSFICLKSREHKNNVVYLF